MDKKEYNKQWYRKNRKRLIEKAKKWEAIYKERNPEKFKENARKRIKRYQSLPQGFYRTLVWNARKRNIEVTITKDEFIKSYNKSKKKCFYCDIPEDKLNLLKTKNGKKRLSIERLDSNLGYAKGNIVLACLVCNQVKSNVFDVDTMKKLSQMFIKPLWKS